MTSRNQCTAALTSLVGLVALSASLSATGKSLEFEFVADDFDNPTIITNDFWGLQLVGDKAVYFSESEDGCEIGESEVTGTTPAGFFDSPYDIQALVVHDREWVSEECDGNYLLVEDTDDWYAQDDQGNVWYMGEDTTAWDEDGDCLTQAGSWKAGFDEAVPGVIMLAEPLSGVYYRQEYYEGEAEDMARVLRLNAAVSIEFGEYAGCLHTKEYTPLAPGEVEHKFYCSVLDGGPGLALINELKGKTKRVEYVGTEKPGGVFGEFDDQLPSCSD